MMLSVMRKHFKFIACIAVLVTYPTAYFLLMDRRMPAINDKFEIAFESSFIIGTTDTTNIRGNTEMIRRTSIFNYLFNPMDVVVRALSSPTAQWELYDDFPQRGQRGVTH